MAIASVVTLSARARCALGSGQACFRAAVDAHDVADDALALRLAERGCALDDERACAMAGRGLWRGLGPTAGASTDRARAEGLLSSGCALGSSGACESLHAVVLQRRCEGYSASACRELAEAYRTGAGVGYDAEAVQRSLRQACLLGDGEACGAR